MRTTLTLDDDVRARLKREMEKRRVPFKALVNTVLRAGLDALEEGPRKTRTPFRTSGLSLGPSRVGSLDNIEEVLTRAEGEHHR
ncbi:MAG: DUF2191 domain-containing protein [Acidimicrobiia bacterium]|nr:DUF2191 domain-containing protein [Acidimicrobiia bacterium]